MNRPEVIMHNSVSMDCRIGGFPANIALHYGIVGGYSAQVYLAGSNTTRIGIEMFGGVPKETTADYVKPEKAASLSYWVIPDSKGSLMGMLHTLRRYEFCRDVIPLISQRTCRAYRDYLEERNYDYIVCGDDVVDYRTAFEHLKRHYKVKRILVDTGPALSGILLKQCLIDEISLLVHPYLAGNQVPGIFEKVDMEKGNIEFKLKLQETLESNYLHMVWRIINSGQK